MYGCVPCHQELGRKDVRNLHVHLGSLDIPRKPMGLTSKAVLNLSRGSKQEVVRTDNIHSQTTKGSEDIVLRSASCPGEHLADNFIDFCLEQGF